MFIQRVKTYCHQGYWAVKIYHFTHWMYERGWVDAAEIVWLLTRWLTSVDIYPSAAIGKRLVLAHPLCVVIGQKVTIGDDVLILQGVTVGATRIVTEYTSEDMPKIGNRVILGAGCKVLGPIRIGDGAMVGANSVVLIDVPAGCTAAGVPARIIGPRNDGSPAGD